MATRSLQNSAIFFLLTAFGLFGHCVADDLSNIISHEDEVHVGVILDMGSKEGKIVYSCISVAVSDFYEMHNNYTTRDIILIYDDTDFVRDIIPYMVDSFHENDINVTYKSAISNSSTDDNVVEELYKLMDFQTKVFVVHMSEAPVSKLLINSKRLGMMSEGYAWFVTASIMNLLSSVDSSIIDSMQGLVGFKSYIPATKDLQNLALRLRRKFSIELSVYGIWAYDSIWALAEAVERARDCNKLVPTIKNGSLLVEEILRSKFLGLSGNFQFINGKLTSNLFEVVNVKSKGKTRPVGFWNCSTEEANRRGHISSAHDLEEPIIWPGGSLTGPRGRAMMSTSKMKLRIGVPGHSKFKGFLDLIKDPQTNLTVFSGFCIEAFILAIRKLPYPVEVEFIPYGGTYNDLVYQVYLGPYSSLEEYAEALSRGSKYGGVSAIVDEVPYIKQFVAKYPGDYSVKTMPMSNMNGFGYVFQKGSALVQDISKELSKLKEAGELAVLENKWISSRAYSEEALLTPSDDSGNGPEVLSLDWFRGLFLISGISSTLALLLFFSFAIKEKMDFLKYCSIVILYSL
ncbi:hypothetical protein FEM48_Zijuj07G0058800 [Ziziphus jujuba var. spinosa]|uniref:Ionotropic glutamate receptor C-terminal domain-containing protein n=1 Tax=Ziziphus jujuba var. spinosa TaxID=714518 RepID=A0A978V2U9_ZIZJJ|nr:hypothetical protein FEM48_Zijuj07G0058800 [Ziziphus jujuba var. spinosa]